MNDIQLVKDRLQDQLDVVSREIKLLSQEIDKLRKDVWDNQIQPAIEAANAPEKLRELEAAWKTLSGEDSTVEALEPDGDRYYGDECVHLYPVGDECSFHTVARVTLPVDVSSLKPIEKAIFGKQRKLFEVQWQLEHALKPGVVEQVLACLSGDSHG